MARQVFYRIDERAVMRFTQNGGEVFDVVDDIAENMKAFARAFAPSRGDGRHPRNLKMSISKLSTNTTGPLRVMGGIATNARYALWVEEGTTGPIRSHNGKKMGFRTNKGKGPMMYAKTVSGQRGQHFMRGGRDAAMAYFRAGR